MITTTYLDNGNCLVSTGHDAVELRPYEWQATAQCDDACELCDNAAWYEALQHAAAQFAAHTTEWFSSHIDAQCSDVVCTQFLCDDHLELLAGILGTGTESEVSALSELSFEARRAVQELALLAVACFALERCHEGVQEALATEIEWGKSTGAYDSEELASMETELAEKGEIEAYANEVLYELSMRAMSYVSLAKRSA